MAEREFDLLPGGANPSLFTYRRIVSAGIYQPGSMIRDDVSLINWPQNDYLLAGLIDQPDDMVRRAHHEAKQLSLCVLYWLQTEAPRADGGTGFPGLSSRPDVTDTADGLAKSAYVREARRIKAVTPSPSTTSRPRSSASTAGSAARVAVGVGELPDRPAPLDRRGQLHRRRQRAVRDPARRADTVRMANLLPAGKNIGTTHITNGCFRLHPVEWNIGEVAGFLAAWCVKRGFKTHQVAGSSERTAEFQRLIQGFGVQISWPGDHLP